MQRQDIRFPVPRARRSRLLGAALLASLALPFAPAHAAPPVAPQVQTSDGVRERIREILAGDASRLGSVTLDGVALRRFYEKRQHNAVWVNDSDRAAVLNAVLGAAAEHGLEDTFPPIALVAALRLAPAERE